MATLEHELNIEIPTCVENEAALNPIVDFPLHISELIVGFLSHQELLKATTVSREWNSIIGSTRAFHKKVLFEVRDISKGSEILDVLTQSERQYENLKIWLKTESALSEIERYDEAFEVYDQLVRRDPIWYHQINDWYRTMHWKDVSVCITHAISCQEFCRFLTLIQPTVVSLSISLRRRGLRMTCEPMAFPSLKKFEFTCNGSTSYCSLEPFAIKQPKIEEFIFEQSSGTSPDKQMMTVLRFIEQNSTIRKLSLIGERSISIFFMNALLKAELRLTKLVIAYCQTAF